MSEEKVRENEEQDRYLPISNISRIMKQALPTNIKIAKDAKRTVQEYASEFISFVIIEACDKCVAEQRKAINGKDVLSALKTLGFDNYADVLEVYLEKYKAEFGSKCKAALKATKKAEDREDLLEEKP